MSSFTYLPLLSVLSKLKVVDLTFLILFLILFSFDFLFLELGLGLRVMRSYCYTSVTSDDMVIVIVTSYMIHRKMWKVLGR